MGRHTINLSDDWSTCTKCNQKLEHGVCMCCGAGSKSICKKCMDTNKKGKDWGWAIGDNVGCDDHLKKTDFRFPKDFPKCEHIIAEEKARLAGWN